MDITPQDFEHLFEVAMDWDAEAWRDQEARFDFPIEVKNGFIYWVENYASLMLCRHFLNQQGHFAVTSFDEASEQWCFITGYDFHSARVGA